MGVDIQLGTMVTDVDRYGIEVKDPDGTKRRIEARAKVWAAGVQGSALGSLLAEQSGAEPRPRRPHPGPARPHAARAPRGARRRRHGRPRRAARRGAGRDPGRPARGPRDPPRPGRRGDRRAVPLQGQGLDGDDLALQRGRLGRAAEVRRLRRLGAVAGGAPAVPGRLQEPGDHAAQVDDHVHRPRAGPSGRSRSSRSSPGGPWSTTSPRTSSTSTSGRTPRPPRSTSATTRTTQTGAGETGGTTGGTSAGLDPTVEQRRPDHPEPEGPPPPPRRPRTAEARARRAAPARRGAPG